MAAPARTFTPPVLDRGSVTLVTLGQFRAIHYGLALLSTVWAVTFWTQRATQPLPLVWPIVFGVAAIASAYTATRPRWWTFIVAFVAFAAGAAGCAATTPLLAQRGIIPWGRMPIAIAGYTGWALMIAFIWVRILVPVARDYLAWQQDTSDVR